MIVSDEHPGLQLLRDAPFDCHLVGSRLVGVFSRGSDYDFLIVAESLHNGLYTWLKTNGFKPDGVSYGKDPRMLSSDVWTREWPGHPAIDLIPVSSNEAKLRLEFFEKMVAAGDNKAGLLAKALKAGKAWPNLWAVVGQERDNDRVAEGRE